jgi:hypothetical protein
MSQKANNLNIGDKIVVRENYNGTVYAAQGIVKAVDASTGAIEVVSWLSGSTFPNGSQTGFSQYADVFNWQQEWIDLSGARADDINAISQISLKLADSSFGRNIWIDDIKVGGPYLTDSQGSSPTSTAQRYLQYRAIFSSNDSNVSPSLSSVTINYSEAILPPPGFIAQNLPNTLVPSTIESAWTDNVSSTPVLGVKELGIRKAENNRRIVTMNVNFAQNLDWTGVTGDTNGAVSFFHVNPEVTSLNSISGGESTDYTLFVPKGDGDKVWICPGASSLSAVTLSCSGGYFLIEGQTLNGATASVSLESDGISYWKIDGLTGTGAISVVTGLKDTLSRLQASQDSDHSIIFGTNGGLTLNGHTMVLEFDPSTKAFDLSTLTISDIVLTDNSGNVRVLASSSGVNTWGVSIDSINDTITFTAPTSGTGYYLAASQIVIKIGTNAGGTNQILNPSISGSFKEYITINNSDVEIGSVDIPIVDSDRVDITGYVSAYMHFDIDTATGEIPGVDPIVDCEFNTCRLYENSQPSLVNYTVDLGELTSALVNKSNSASVLHSDGGSGIVNSIYFDISTNAPSGAVVTVKSLNGGLQGPGINIINSVIDGNDISANSGTYGYNLPVASSQIYGSIIPNAQCDSEITFCGPTQLSKTVFTTNNLPVDTARVRMDLAAAASYTNNPVNYTDTLTFVATSTF